MKQTDMIVLGLAGVAVYMIVKGKGGNPLASLFAALPAPSAGTTEIFDSRGLPHANGWRYYSDGTSIGPDGKYYLNGQLVYTP